MLIFNKPTKKKKEMGVLFSRNEDSIENQVDRVLRIRQLEHEIQSLKADNNELRQEMMRELNQRRVGVQAKGMVWEHPSEVSQLEVDRFVEGLLADPNTNMGAIPDFLEGPAQKTMLMYLLKSIAHAIDTSAIEFMGHEVVMRMQPMHTGEPDPPHTPDEGEYGDYYDEDYEEGEGGNNNLSVDFDANSIPM